MQTLMHVDASNALGTTQAFTPRLCIHRIHRLAIAGSASLSGGGPVASSDSWRELKLVGNFAEWLDNDENRREGERVGETAREDPGE